MTREDDAWWAAAVDRAIRLMLKGDQRRLEAMSDLLAEDAARLDAIELIHARRQGGGGP